MDMAQMPKLVTSTSALRRIPMYVEDDDKVVLDGIRYSLEIADRVYRRLRQTLWDVSSDPEADHVEHYVDLVSDAWTVVDSFNRLHVLCKSNCTYLDHNYCRDYADALQPVVKVRNAHQHMKGRLEKIVADKESAWGAISWISCATNPPTHADAHCFVAGSVRLLEATIPELPQRQFYMPIDGITVRADKTEVFVSDLMLSTVRFAEQLDADLSNQFPIHTTHSRDAYAMATYSFNNSNVRAPRITIALKQANVPLMNRAARRQAQRKR